MSEPEKAKVGLIDLLLLLGCLAVLEMIIVILFWDDIALNDQLAFLRPRQPLEKISTIALIGGLIALFNTAFGLFTDAVKPYIYRKYLAMAFLVCLLIFGVFYVVY